MLGTSTNSLVPAGVTDELRAHRHDVFESASPQFLIH
jgi:hypothetical protein